MRRSYKHNRRTARYYGQKQTITLQDINWVSVGIAVLVLAALVTGIVLLVRSCSNQAKPASLSTPTDAQTAQTSPEPSFTPGLSTPLPGSSEQYPLDLSQTSTLVISQEKNINMPSIFGNEMVFSAGTGSLRLPLLKKLYLYDLESGTETLVAEAQVKNGEIYDTLINENYIAWLDTNQNGTNQIYYYKRFPEEGEEPLQLVKECEYAMPKLRLYGDYLLWTEQNADKEERLYMVHLVSGENVALPSYTESIIGQESTYGVSAPDVHGNIVIWAAPDESQSEAERVMGEKSTIYVCDLDQLSDDDYQPEPWNAGMYVHEPITNGKAWAWIDRNKAPDSSLWVKYGDEVVKVSSGVTNYCFGDGMLVYGKESAVWVYFYETGMYGRITPENEPGILPIATGRKVVWFDLSEESADKDQLKIVYVP